MSLLFETIKCDNGKLLNLEFHQKRFNRSRKEYFGTDEILSLDEIISVPEGLVIKNRICSIMPVVYLIDKEKPIAYTSNLLQSIHSCYLSWTFLGGGENG